MDTVFDMLQNYTSFNNFLIRNGGFLYLADAQYVDIDWDKRLGKFTRNAWYI